jgi:hypothetical protein
MGTASDLIARVFGAGVVIVAIKWRAMALSDPADSVKLAGVSGIARGSVRGQLEQAEMLIGIAAPQQARVTRLLSAFQVGLAL